MSGSGRCSTIKGLQTIRRGTYYVARMLSFRLASTDMVAVTARRLTRRPLLSTMAATLPRPVEPLDAGLRFGHR
jgi:hypothetical protein